MQAYTHSHGDHGHSHDGGEDQANGGGENRRNTNLLMVSLVLTLAFVVFETVAGFQAKSLALLSDAGHNFTDAFALLLAAFGIYLQARPGDHERTFGYQRAGVLAAFVNALSLVVLAFVLLGNGLRDALDTKSIDEDQVMY